MADPELDLHTQRKQAPNNDPEAVAGAKELWDKFYRETATKCIHAARGEVSRPSTCLS